MKRKVKQTLRFMIQEAGLEKIQYAATVTKCCGDPEPYTEAIN